MSPELPAAHHPISVDLTSRAGQAAKKAASSTPLSGFPSFSATSTPSASPFVTTPASSARGAAASSSSGPVAADPATPATPGDLDTGSVTHRAAAGAQAMVIDYWTTQDPLTWTPATEATIQLSAHLEGAGSPPKTLVTAFTATGVDASGRRTILTQDTGSFVVTRGFSYSGAFVVPASAPSATRTTVTLQWDLAVETYRGSGQFYRQTVLDTLDLALAHPTKPASPATRATGQ